MISAVTRKRLVTAQSGSNYLSYILETCGYGFNVPATATITGTKVESKCYATASDTQVAVNQLYKASGIVGVSRTTALLPTSLGWMSYGCINDLWGTTWAPSDINNDGFGLGLAFRMMSGGVYVDAVRITVYYCPAPQGYCSATQAFTVFTYRSNGTSYFVRLTMICVSVNGWYAGGATFMRYENPQFNATHWVGDYLIFNFTRTLAQHYDLIAAALNNIVNLTYAPLAQQNQTAYQLVIAYTALAQHAGKLANFTAAYLQAYNKQITNATALVTDPPMPIIPDVDIPIRGGYRVPTGGSGVPPASGSQGSSPRPGGPNYLYQASPTTGLTWDEARTIYFQFLFLSVATFLPGFLGALSGWEIDLLSVSFPALVSGIPSLVVTFSMFFDNRIGLADVALAIGGFVVSFIAAVLSVAWKKANFWVVLATSCGFAAEVASGVGFAIALVAFIIGLLWLAFTLIVDWNN